MKKLIITMATSILLATPSVAQVTDEQEMLERVYLDAQVVKRVAEVAHRDLPVEVLEKIVEQDIELLRGKRPDGTYEHAHFEPIESGRVKEGFSVRSQGDDGQPDRNQFRAKNVFRLIVDIPSRRLLVARNRDIFLDRIEVSYEDQEGESKIETFEVLERIEAGNQREFQLPEVASDAIATVYASTDSKSANMELIFVKAELVDNADSPYFGIIQSAKLLQEAIGRRDPTAMQSLASSMAGRIDTLIVPPQEIAVEEIAERAEEGEPAIQPADEVGVLEIYLQLERIEDLLNGPEMDQREGMSQLHDLIRELRTEALEAAGRP
ncbi:MAG: hypothetical protein R3338_00625 [Thermoanaerobaculia bacterium]|nr:hypothetical protein [Thermoanaerobaculia bacterium]